MFCISLCEVCMNCPLYFIVTDPLKLSVSSLLYSLQLKCVAMLSFFLQIKLNVHIITKHCHQNNYSVEKK